MRLVPRMLVLGLGLPIGGLVLAVFVAGHLFHRALLADVDQRLLAQAAVESVSLFDGPDRKPHLHLPQSPLAGEVAAFATYSALYAPDGRLLMTDPPSTQAPEHLARETPSTRPILTTRDHEVRELDVSVLRAGEGYYTLHLATSLTPVSAAVSLFYRVIGGTIGFLAVALGLLLHAQASRLVARLRELSAAVPHLRAARPIAGPIARGADELGELGRTLVDAAEHIHAQQASQERFLANAAHQLRTPLTVIRTEIDLALRRERSTEQLRDALARARSEVDRLALLARKLLDFESLRVRPVQVREVDLGAPLQDALRRLGTTADERQVRLDARLAPHLPCTGDALLLSQAIENVLDNAIRFAPASSVVRVEARLQGTVCQVLIHDDGPGIPPDERARLFEPFHRGSSAGSQTGLGLAFAAEVLRQHEGHIRLIEPDAPGTTFLLELPAHPAAERVALAS